jgi:hypothetical protein
MRSSILLAAPLLLGALLVSEAAPAQSPAAKTEAAKAEAKAEMEREAGVQAIRDSVAKQTRTFKMGLSLGWRHVLASGGNVVRDATIDPMTNNVRVDEIDNGAVVLSAILTAFPWKHDSTNKLASRWRWLGFLANVNLAAFGAENISTFNESIEGGGGLAVRLSDEFSVGMTVERVFSRRLRSFVAHGAPLVVQGDTITSLSRTDDRFFRDDNLTALSFKFLYFIR